MHNGKPFEDKDGYYSKIFKGKLFKIAGKQKEVEEVFEYQFFSKKENVRWLVEGEVKQIIDSLIQLEHKCFIQLCWDIGENAGALLQLKKQDCIRQVNQETGEVSYMIHLRKEILKRSRTSRYEPTLYEQTAKYLETILAGKQDEDLIFNFDLRNAEKFFDRAIAILKIKSKPDNSKPSLKTIRSSMAMHLLEIGFSVDDINFRLGHKAGSTHIQKYIDASGINKRKPKEQIQSNNIKKLREELEASKTREILSNQKIEKLMSQLKEMGSGMCKVLNRLEKLEKHS